MARHSPIAAGGARLENIWPTIAAQIQAVSDRYGVEIALVGSRAAGTSHRLSDFDFVISASHRVRHSAKYFLPRGPQINEASGIDIFAGPVDTSCLHIVFFPSVPTH